jgi:formylglycine-generating enzyme required for sulfatase activity
MKLIQAFCTFLAVCLLASVSARAQTAPANPPADTNTPPAAATNNVPGDKYTNCVEMELIKVGDYWAGKVEVTQKQYLAVMSSNPSQFSGDTRPVDSVTWQDAMAFCQKMTDMDLTSTNALPKGYYYTLPTESEWESLVSDADLKDAVTSMGGARGSTSPVGSLGPNSLGLYDTRGNVAEFTLGDTGKPYRVLRGGSWQDSIEVNLRLAFRIYVKPDETKNTYGFRVLLKKKSEG